MGGVAQRIRETGDCAWGFGNTIFWSSDPDWPG